MPPNLRLSVIHCQRHSVTDVRYKPAMSIGDRIKERLEEIGKDVRWLHKATRVPVSTLYEIINGRLQIIRILEGE